MPMVDAKGLRERRTAARQAQFLDVAGVAEAADRFRSHLRMAPLGAEDAPLSEARDRVIAGDVVAGIDVPGFDRTNVDGFAVRAADTAGASEDAPCRVTLNSEVITPGVVPRETVTPGTATVLATGGMIPRGADAVIMVEDTDVENDDGFEQLLIRRPVAAGAFITFAGTDIARGETVLRSGQLLTSRELGVLAAIGRDTVSVYRRPRVAVISTGDEIVPPGSPLPEGGVYDSNQAIVAAAVEELGGTAIRFGAVPDDEEQLERVLGEALGCDMVILSGGTSKGAGDLCYQVVSRLRDPGVLVHGVAIKPGKPLCLAVTDGTPVVILPGFPTSAIFTFHQFVAPVLRVMAGKGEEQSETVSAVLATRTTSERGRTEYKLVNLVAADHGLAAYPIAKGSGAVTSFSQADGFVVIDAQQEQLAAGEPVEVNLLSRRLEPADLVSIGSHCVGLDLLLGCLQREGYATKAMHVGSTGGLTAARRGECDIAGIHLLDPDTGEYNRPFLEEGLELVSGYRRMQGVVFRPGDARFSGRDSAPEAVGAALADDACVMVNRNTGSGTRLLIDRLLAGRQPPGYAVQAKSHNAVATAVAQERADWGVAIDTVARDYGLGFIPLREEHYDFIVPANRRGRPAVRRFIELLNDADVRRELAGFGFRF
ncbi:MAG: molybdopterin biosynthesis protein [Gammaproteobacteria bacterium]|nr:molybdopterin biosynthesis protein [Gammaproteobacteria bacterium]